MKIVHAVYSLEMGGAEVLVAQLCRIQRANGHDVSVCVYSALGALGEKLRDEGFHVQAIGEAHPLLTIFRYYKAFLHLRPDVVHCHNPAPTIQASLGARLAGASCIVSTRHSLVAPPYDLAEERKFGVFAFFCNWIVGICDATCENLRGAPFAHGDRIVRVYNGAAAVAPVSDADKPRKNGPTMLFIGRLAPVKDLGTLIQAFACALVRAPELNLWIVGDGPSRGQLEELASRLGVSGRIVFWGQQLEVAPFFRSADVFVMTSISEGLPMSLLQAMSAGLPALVTEVGGMGEVVRLSECGLLAPAGDAPGIATAIVQLAACAKSRLAYGRRAVEAYRTHFTIEHMDAEYMKLYRRGRG